MLPVCQILYTSFELFYDYSSYCVTIPVTSNVFSLQKVHCVSGPAPLLLLFRNIYFSNCCITTYCFKWVPIALCTHYTATKRPQRTYMQLLPYLYNYSQLQYFLQGLNFATQNLPGFNFGWRPKLSLLPLTCLLLLAPHVSIYIKCGVYVYIYASSMSWG